MSKGIKVYHDKINIEYEIFQVMGGLTGRRKTKKKETKKVLRMNMKRKLKPTTTTTEFRRHKIKWTTQIVLSA